MLMMINLYHTATLNQLYVVMGDIILNPAGTLFKHKMSTKHNIKYKILYLQTFAETASCIFYLLPCQSLQ